MTPEAEPGFKTTEFWVTLVTAIVGLLTAFHVVRITADQQQAVLGVVMILVPIVAYALARGIRKQGTSG